MKLTIENLDIKLQCDPLDMDLWFIMESGKKIAEVFRVSGGVWRIRQNKKLLGGYFYEIKHALLKFM